MLFAHQYSAGAAEEWQTTGGIHLFQFWKSAEPAVLFTGTSDPLSLSVMNSAEIHSQKAER